MFATVALTLLRRLGRRSGWLTPVLLVLGVLAFYAPVIFGGRAFFLKDAQLVYYPVRMVLRERLLAGDLPEWLPHLDLGLPFLANPTNGVLYPLSLVLLLPAPWSVGLFIVLHAALAALGSFMLGRMLRLGAGASAVAGLAFPLGGYMVSLTWAANYMVSLAWLPWVGFFAVRASRRRSLAQAGLAGLSLGLQLLSGEPQGTLLTLWFMVALALSHERSWRSRLRSLGLTAVAVLLGFCLAMPQVLPAAELLERSRRASGIDLMEAQHWSLHPLRLLELLVPWLFGSPLDHSSFLGYFMNDEGGPIHRDPWMVTPYFGSFALLFAVVGIVAPRQRHRGWVRALAVLTAVTLLVALGRHTPAFAAYFSFVPAANVFRYPAKYFGLVAAALPFIAAAGVESFRLERRPSRLFLGLVGSLALALLFTLGLSGYIAAALQELRPEVSQDVAQTVVESALRVELLMVVLLGASLALARRAVPRELGAVAAVALSVQLGIHTFRAYESAPASIFLKEPALARAIREKTPIGEVPRVLHALPGVELDGFPALPGPKRAELLVENLPMDVGLLFGVHYARSYFSSEEGLKWRLWNEVSPRLLSDLFGVRGIVASGLSRPPDDTLVPIAGVGSPFGAMYWNSTALPYAFAVQQPVLVKSQEDAIAALTEPAIVRGRAAAIEAEEGSLLQRKGTRGSCGLLAEPGDDIRLRCQLAESGWVVVNASYHPNYRAKLGSVGVPVYRANGFVMAVFLPSGTHELVFEYEEPSLELGVLIAGLGLLVMFGLCWRERGPSDSRRGVSQK